MENINVVERTDLYGSAYVPETKTIYWPPTMGIVTNNDVAMSPATVLNHEAGHALGHVNNPKKSETDHKTPDTQYRNKEKIIIQGTEQKTARLLGETKGESSYKNRS